MDRPPPGTRVLLVEDEHLIAMLVEDMLTNIGCEAAAIAGTLPDAIARASDTEFDVAVLDWSLPGGNSLSVARQLRQRGKRFLFSTGHDRLPEGSGFTAVPILKKPYRIDQLAQKLVEALADP